MSNFHRTGTGRLKVFANTLTEREEYDLAVANGWRTETCRHGYTWRSRCNSGCDDPKIPAPVRPLGDGA